VARSRSGLHPSATSELHSSLASFSDASGASPRESWCGCTPVEAPDAVLPVCHGEDFLGWHLAVRAGTAPPCCLDTHLGER
jgi:hypothetical protein